MKRCRKCLMPVTARNIGFADDGECFACKRAATPVDREKRMDELYKLCDTHRRSDGAYDCIIPVSGGKDSFTQVHMMKNVMGMNPLLLSVTDEFEHTKVGERNTRQISKAFKCDMTTLRLNPEMVRETTKWGFEKIGSTNWAIDMAIYAWPLRQAIKEGIKLIVYGENVEWEYGCSTGKDTYSALGQINNNVVNTRCGPPINEKEANCVTYPSTDEIVKSRIEPIYLSYFTGWDGMKNANLAKRYGFRNLKGEWDREGYVDTFWQVDSVGYLMNYYLKYAKYGYSKATDVASHLIRCGYLSRLDAVQQVRDQDCKLDQKVLDDFLRFTGYSDSIFWEIMDTWFSQELFDYINNTWVLKDEHKF